MYKEYLNHTLGLTLSTPGLDIVFNCISFRWFALKAPIEEFYYFLFYLQRLLCESLHYLELLRMDRIFVFIPAVSGLDG